MMAQPVIPRLLARQDVDDAISYYLSEHAPKAAYGFIDALEAAYSHLSRHSGSGSPRYAHEVDLPGLRSWALKRFPYIVFYVEQDTKIDVWRVLHESRDIPTWMREGSDAAQSPSSGAA